MLVHQLEGLSHSERQLRSKGNHIAYFVHYKKYIHKRRKRSTLNMPIIRTQEQVSLTFMV